MILSNIRLSRLIFCLAVLSLGNIGRDSGLFAQNAGTSSSFYMQVRTTPNKKLSISWVPLDIKTFQQGFKQGYTLSRYDSATQQTTLLSSRIVPQDTMAIKAALQPDSAWLTYYTQLAYWMKVAKDSPDVRLGYYQLVCNGREHPQTAILTGLGWTDTTTLKTGGRYRYDLKLNGSNETAQVGIEYNSNLVFNLNGLLFPTLDFGDSTPLSNYMPRTRPTQIFAVAKAFGDSIYLRWTPDSYSGWVMGNKEGYKVRRTEFIGNKLSDTAIVMESFKPLPLEAFAEEPIKSDTGCIIAAQALYGANMKVSSDASLMSKADQSEMRFTVALQAADKSFLGAQVLGLGMVDNEVQRGKKYQYDILPLGDGIPASIVVDNSVITPAKPIDFKATQGDRWIQLNWSFENRKQFTMYKLYRSDDNGTTYKLLTPEPIAFLLNGSETDTFRYTFSDSIPANYKPYKYRLSGLDMFAAWSPFAELETFGRDLTPPKAPIITEGVSTTSSFDIKWSLDSVDADLAGFQVFIGNSTEGDFKPISKLLSKDVRQYTHRDTVSLTRSYYFRVMSMDTAGNAAYSGPYYVLVIDSIPPATPLSMRGKISKTGVVRLTWQHGTEADLVGYRVYSSSNNQEFRLLTDAPIDSNAYQDTLPLNTLNKKMYYKVVAEDQNGNKSPYSVVVMIQKPDTIAPVMPVMEQPEGTDKGVILKWTASSSTDVMAHLLYRKPDNDTTAKWALLQTLDATTESYTDTSAWIEKPYLYYMVAQDSAENISEQTLTVGGRRFFDGKADAIKTVKAVFDEKQKAIQVSWQIAPVTDPFLKDKNFFIFIYRAKEDAPLEKYQQIEGKNLPAFVDDEVGKGQYRYALCMAYEDGKITSLTKEVIVDIE
jgi:hypothetical protein